jgi:hypothetical protein
MSNEPKLTKSTIEMCYHKDEHSESCEFSPKWTVASAKTAFRVCDKHLAWGIRLSGAPARVDEYQKPSEEDDTKPIKYEPSLIANERRAKKQTVQLTVMKNPATMKREEEGGRTIISERPFAKTDDEKH